ncbi:MAG: membrane protein [Candidatus Dojkabacteria bacterium]|nr:MAG: membrane protein [Candidatus Dojkabacteria bacterium]
MAVGLIFLVVCLCLVFFFLGFVLYIISVYNKLQKQHVLVDEAWSGIDVQLKRRFDLIPDFIESVKGYKQFEADTLTKVTELRSKMMGTDSPEKLAMYENQLSSTLKSIFAVAENYPELKSNTMFSEFNQANDKIEEAIQSARRYYNGAVRDLNRMIVVFPTNIIANFLGIKKREFFEIQDASQREDVKADFS